MTAQEQSRRGTWRAAWTLSRTELITTLRNVRGNGRQLVGFAVIGLMAIGFPLVLWEQTTGFGRELAAGTSPVGTLAASYLGVAFAGGYVGSVGGFNQSRVGVVGPLIRTSIPPTAVSIGRFVTRTVEGLAGIVPTGLVLLVGVGVGAGNPVVPVVIGVGALPLLAAGVIAGRFVGDAVRYVNERVQLSLWVRAGLFLGLTIAAFVGTQAVLNPIFEEGSTFGPDSVGAILPGSPVQAYANLVLAPLGATVGGLGLVVAGVLVIVVPVGFVAVIRLETLLLVRNVGGDSASERVSGTHSVPWLFDRTPSTRIAWRYLLRTRRDPRTLAHLTPVLFGAMGMSGTALEDPHRLLSIGPAAAVIAGAILAGGAYCLNPLGDDREQLPLLFSSTSSVAPLLRGRMVAGIVLGLVVGIGVGTPLALLEHEPAFVVGQSVLAVVLAVASTGIALGLGAAVPKFERREYMNVERAHPSLAVTIAFFMGGILVGAIGFALLWVGLTQNLVGGLLALLGYTAVLGLVAAGGYWYAIRRFRTLTLDEL
ncbi:hypothetical protein HLRTI_000226 [Halorhabdus tiamatea SARL4B]|uniref:Conserved hypothetical membrane protein n=1 Tax=Halorhabdus tiamatea SARL4B TaxID=1033806 RepID=F7PJX9_9EURY|nr:hypothetical protein [Halorhabdus tiamatea]ERJ07508.1 hypothetical protein HLRTI_000226 [Halorhabdus tiamatea SARL4B]CCQ33542.1 conserved hypothetical membrane protein [Halorhabdus tiamatea SARL4B]